MISICYTPQPGAPVAPPRRENGTQSKGAIYPPFLGTSEIGDKLKNRLQYDGLYM